MPTFDPAATVPSPGSADGPCREVCGHDGCASLRRSAAVACAVCGAAVGYDTPFLAAFGERVHGACLRPPTGARPVLGRYSRP